jgi:hypothetical protein
MAKKNRTKIDSAMEGNIMSVYGLSKDNAYSKYSYNRKIPKRRNATMAYSSFLKCVLR